MLFQIKVQFNGFVAFLASIEHTHIMNACGIDLSFCEAGNFNYFAHLVFMFY